jgi:hypothetical protein
MSVVKDAAPQLCYRRAVAKLLPTIKGPFAYFQLGRGFILFKEIGQEVFGGAHDTRTPAFRKKYVVISDLPASSRWGHQ